MSGKLVSQVFLDDHKDRMDLLVMVAIADWVNERRGNVAWPSMNTLATKCRCSQRMARRVVARLVAAKKLEVKRGGGPRGTNTYRVILPLKRADTRVRGVGHPVPPTPDIAVSANQIVPNLKITRVGVSSVGQSLHLDRVKKAKIEQANDLKFRHASEVSGGDVIWNSKEARAEHRTLWADIRKITKQMAGMV